MNEHEIKLALIFFVVYIILTTNKILLNFVVFDPNEGTDSTLKIF